jgi:hypothetical protein
MAATRIIEEDRGVYVGSMHAHNGYYAGDFSRRGVRPATVPNTHPVVPTPAHPFIDLPPRRSPRR